MPIWLQIVIAVFGLVSTIFGIFGISAYITERAKHRASKKNQEEDEVEEMKREAYVAELKNIIGEALIPINKKLDSIDNDLGLVKSGLQKDLYVDLVHIYNDYKDKGWASIGEKKDYDSLYWTYHNLGKNGVADNMHEFVMNLPETKPVTKRKPRTKKKILVENK